MTEKLIGYEFVYNPDNGKRLPQIQASGPAERDSENGAKSDYLTSFRGGNEGTKKMGNLRCGITPHFALDNQSRRHYKPPLSTSWRHRIACNTAVAVVAAGGDAAVGYVCISPFGSNPVGLFRFTGNNQKGANDLPEYVGVMNGVICSPTGKRVRGAMTTSNVIIPMETPLYELWK
jgi:hypothetical protein